MKILVAGASGFIGRHLVRHLIDLGHSVHALVRRNEQDLPCSVGYIEDFSESSLYIAIANHVDVVINLVAAGVDPTYRKNDVLMNVNAAFPMNLCLAANSRGSSRFIHIGSSAEYSGQTYGPISEESPLERFRFYGTSKAAGSLLVQATGKNIGLPTAVLRLFNVFGSGEKPHRLVPSLFDRLASGQAVPLSDGEQIRDFLYVEDACDAIGRFLSAFWANPELQGEYNLASGVPIKVKTFAHLIAQAAGAPPELLKFGELERRKDDLPVVFAATGKLDALIGPAQKTEPAHAVGQIWQQWCASSKAHCR